jgi:hypothetical protein
MRKENYAASIKKCPVIILRDTAAESVGNHDNAMLRKKVSWRQKILADKYTQIVTLACTRLVAIIPAINTLVVVTTNSLNQFTIPAARQGLPYEQSSSLHMLQIH